MTKTFNSLDKQVQLIDTSFLCILKTDQSITIPKTIREILSLVPGDEVTIGLTVKSRELIIRRLRGTSLDNKLIISERGAIRIPTEFRKLLRLKKGDKFHIIINKRDNAILLKKINSETKYCRERIF